MRVAVKATKGKGRSWSKHQACVSNPQTKKHRDKAKQSTEDVFRKNTIPNADSQTLTVESLANHNAFQFRGLSLDDDNNNNDGRSVKTFASVWSSCTNPNFERFLESWSAESEVQREMLTILRSAVETIKGKGGSQSNTEFFAILLTLIDTTESEITLTAAVELLRILIGHMPRAVLVKCFADCAPALTKLLIKVKDRSNQTLISGLISCLKHFLRTVDAATWNESSNVVYLDCLATLALHSDQNIRTVTRKAVNAIASSGNGSADKFALYCIKRVKDTNVKDNVNKIVYLMNLMKGIMLHTSEEILKKSCEITLSLLLLNHPIVNSFAFNILAVPFSSPKSQITLPLAVRIMNALFEFQPQVGSAESVVSWLSTIKQAHVSLKTLDSFASKKFTPKMLSSHVSFYISDSRAVHACISNNLKQLIDVLLGEGNDHTDAEVATISRTIDSSLDFKYAAAWTSSLSVIAYKLLVMGCKYPALSMETVQNLTSLRQAHQFTYYTELDEALAVAVTHLGPEKILKIVDFSLTEKGLERTWIFTVMKGRIVNAPLAYFVDTLWPMAQQAKAYEEKFNANDPPKARIFKIIYCQIWSLLPSFCNQPCDVVKSFPRIAPIMGSMMKEDTDIRPCILTALRTLLKQCEMNEDEKTAINAFSKNFFSVLLNIYTSEVQAARKDARLPVYDTIVSFVRIAPIDVVEALLLKAIDKYNSTDELEKKVAYLDLLRAFTAQVSLQSLKTVYDTIVVGLLNEKNIRLQKKGFRILEEMCRSCSQSCTSFVTQELHSILRTLVKGAENSAPAARSSPLNSLRHLIARFFTLAPDEVEPVSRKLLPLIFKSLKVQTTRIKVASLELIQTLVRASFMQAHGKEVMKNLLIEYLMDKSYSDSTLMCICFILDILKSNLSTSDVSHVTDIILNDCSSTDSLARTRAVLAYMKALLKHLDKDEFAPYLEKCVTWINKLTRSSKCKCRLVLKEILTKLLRRYGAEYLCKAICSDLRKVVSNIRKAEKKKNHKSKSVTGQDAASRATSKVTKKTRKTIMSEMIHESDDDASDEEFDPRAKKNTPNVSLKEDSEHFDLLDSRRSNTVHVKETKDMANESDDDIVIGEDGKFIIPDTKGVKRAREDDDDDDEEEEDTRSTKTASVKSNKSSASKYQPGGRGIHRKVPRKHQHLLEAVKTGDEFKSKKARGDVKRGNNATDPYAYFPLVRASLNKRRKVSLKDQYKKVFNRNSK